MIDLARGPLGALLPPIASLPDPVSVLLPNHGRSRSQDAALDLSQTEQWESEGGASADEAGDADPLSRVAIGSFTLPPTSRHVPGTHDQKLEWTRLAFEAAQARWEAMPLIGPVTRDDEREEPASKAVGNRARVAFLSVKGATMQGWIAHCAADSNLHGPG